MKFEENFETEPSDAEISRVLAGVERATNRIEKETEQNDRAEILSKARENSTNFGFRGFLEKFLGKKEIQHDGLEKAEIINKTGLDMDENAIISVLTNFKDTVKNDYYLQKEIPVFDNLNDIKKITIEYLVDEKISFVIDFNKKYSFSKPTTEIVRFDIDSDHKITIPHKPI